jgi:hypothetical protein
MTQGILLFAHSSEEINYGMLAVWMSERIMAHLDKPVSIVTDEYTIKSLKNIGVDPTKYFDKIIFKEYDVVQSRRLLTEYIPFKNLDRCDAYDLTPYDETLVLDIDIAIASDTLNSVWGCDEDILISNSSIDILDRQQDEFLFLKDHGIKFHWATEFYFRKSPLAEEFFTRCKTIKENYTWYAILYGIPNYPLRNDHVWSIAIHEMGYPFATIPRKLRYAIDKDSIVQLNTDGVVIAGEADKKQRLVKLKNQDVHLMNKFELVILTAFEMGVLL